MRANHYNLNESLFRKGYIETDRCDCGNETQDIYHILYRCRNYDEVRIRMSNRMERRNDRREWDVDKWLRELDIPCLLELWRFVRDAGRVI